MGMHFLAITAGGFGWVRVGSEQEKEKGKNGGRILLIGCACLAHLLCGVCVCVCVHPLEAELLHCLRSIQI